MLDLLGGSLGAVLLMGLAAVVIGFSKTALGGLAVVSVAIFATILPAKESTAVGYATVRRISQRRFDVAVLLASTIAAIALLV